jgi:hypothetical protein
MRRAETCSARRLLLLLLPGVALLAASCADESSALVDRSFVCDLGDDVDSEYAEKRQKVFVVFSRFSEDGARLDVEEVYISYGAGPNNHLTEPSHGLLVSVEEPDGTPFDSWLEWDTRVGWPEGGGCMLVGDPEGPVLRWSFVEEQATQLEVVDDDGVPDCQAEEAEVPATSMVKADLSACLRKFCKERALPNDPACQ